MSSVLHPVGPEDARTYWLRRLALVVGIIVVIAVIVWAIPKPSRQAVPPAGPTQPGPTGPATSGSTGVPTASDTPSTSGTPTPTEPTACTATQVRVSTAGPAQVAADKNAKLTVTIINTSTVPCIASIDAKALEVRVISGSDRIWTTEHCAKWLPTVKATTLTPGKSIGVSLTWPGKRSIAGCKVGGGLKPGTYVAKALYGDADPGNLIMTMK